MLLLVESRDGVPAEMLIGMGEGFSEEEVVVVLVSHGSGWSVCGMGCGLKRLLAAAAAMSRPVVKARSPAPETMIVRQEGFWER